MNKRKQYLKRAGGIAGIIIAILAIFGLIRWTTSDAGKTLLHGEFESVLGLVTYSDVTVAGAKVGDVQKIEVSDNGVNADLTLAIDPDVASTLRADASAQVRLKSLLGEIYIELDPGTTSQGLIDSTIVNTGSDLSLDDLLASLGGTLGDISETGLVGDMVAQLNAELGGKGPQFESIVKNSRELIRAISLRSDTIANIITNTDILTETVDAQSGALGAAISSGARTLENLRGTLSENMETINTAIDQLESILNSIDQAQLDQALSEIPEWLGKINKVLNALEDLVTGKAAVNAFFVSIPDMKGSMEMTLLNLRKYPWIREPMIRMFEKLCPTPDTLGCTPTQPG